MCRHAKVGLQPVQAAAARGEHRQRRGQHAGCRNRRTPRASRSAWSRVPRANTLSGIGAKTSHHGGSPSVGARGFPSSLGQERLQTLLGNGFQQSVHLPASLDPATNGPFQGMGDIDHLPLVAPAIHRPQRRVLLALLAPAALLSTGPQHSHQTAPQQGLLGHALHRLRAGVAFSGRSMGSGRAPCGIREGMAAVSVSVIAMYNRNGGATQEINHCDYFAPVRSRSYKTGQDQHLRRQSQLTCGTVCLAASLMPLGYHRIPLDNSINNCIDRVMVGY